MTSMTALALADAFSPQREMPANVEYEQPLAWAPGELGSPAGKRQRDSQPAGTRPESKAKKRKRRKMQKAARKRNR